MRVTTALNRLLALRGVSVTGVRLTGKGVMVRVRLRRRRIACWCAARSIRACTIGSVRRWRHLDLGGHRCFLEYELRQGGLQDAAAGRGGPRAVAPGTPASSRIWSRSAAQRMAKSQVQSLLRVASDTVGRIIERVVADRLDDPSSGGPDPDRRR